MPDDPSTFTPAQLERWISEQTGKSQSAPVAAQPIDDLSKYQLLPATREALGNISADLNTRLDPDFLSKETQRMGVRPGVAFDPNRGAPTSVRAALSFDRNTLNQYKLLTKVYGPGNVDVSDDGRFIVRNQDNPTTGLKEDFPVDPIGMDVGDIAGMSGDVLPIIAGAVGARFGGKLSKRPPLKLLGGLGFGALGAEGTTATEQIISRIGQHNELKPGELASERAKAALADMALGTILAGGAKTMTKAGNTALGLLGIPTGETATTRAAKALQQSTGVKYPLTPGEAAESPLLMRVEATAKPRMGSVSVMSAFDEGKAAAEDELRRVLLGLPRTLTDEELAAVLPRADATGQKVLGRLGTEALQLEGNVAKAKGALQETGTREAQQIAGVDLSAPLEPTAVGKALRSKTVQSFETHRANFGKRYEEFLSKPEISERNVKGDTLAKEAARVEEELTPAAVKAQEVPAYDAYGNPTSRMRVGTERLDAFVPAKVKSFLGELKGLKGSQVSVNDLKQIRTSIDNGIAEGLSIPGTDVKQLTTLRDKVTDAITTALGDMEDKSLLGQWQKLNKDFAADRARFDRAGIREMLIKEGEQGSVGNAQLARSVGSGQPSALDRYNDFKEFFGPASSEFRQVQQFAREQVLKGALDETTDYVSGSALRSRLRSIDPEVAQDLFGASKQELHRIGEALSVAQGNLDLNELSKLAGSRSLTATKIPELMAAERARASAWGNKLIRAAAKGAEIDAETIKPSEVVRNLSNLDPDDAARITGILSDRPELLHDVRQLAVEDIWGRVQGELKGRQGVTSTLIENALGNETQQRTWKTLLGSKAVDDLLKISKVVESQEMGTRVFKSAGSMGATADLTRLEKGGLVEVGKEAAARMLIGIIYTGPARQAVINLATKQNQGRLLNAIAASSPFLERVIQQYGPDAWPRVMSGARSLIEPQHSRELQIQGTVKGDLDPSTLSPDEFKEWMNNNMKQ